MINHFVSKLIIKNFVSSKTKRVAIFDFEKQKITPATLVQTFSKVDVLTFDEDQLFSSRIETDLGRFIINNVGRGFKTIRDEKVFRSVWLYMYFLLDRHKKIEDPNYEFKVATMSDTELDTLLKNDRQYFDCIGFDLPSFVSLPDSGFFLALLPSENDGTLEIGFVFPLTPSFVIIKAQKDSKILPDKIKPTEISSFSVGTGRVNSIFAIPPDVADGYDQETLIAKLSDSVRWNKVAFDGFIELKDLLKKKHAILDAFLGREGSP